MSDRPWDAATATVMDGECEVEVAEIALRWHGDAPDEVTICATHGCDWDDDEPIPCYEHRRIDVAVRAGWLAALADACGELHPKFESQERCYLRVGHDGLHALWQEAKASPRSSHATKAATP